MASKKAKLEAKEQEELNTEPLGVPTHSVNNNIEVHWYISFFCTFLISKGYQL